MKEIRWHEGVIGTISYGLLYMSNKTNPKHCTILGFIGLNKKLKYKNMNPLCRSRINLQQPVAPNEESKLTST